ncbi:MAG: glycosyltransferase family 4 protein [Candidatus Omnitrophica bacterium]|nr:glycosyltransferase family 4 protein [Candidatus Omnitrophota bacterium]MDD5591903.1 glycosyltransferase family 4 protein [Candidatus Omnitrophota bacterium]
MRILFWVPYPKEGASNRYRVEQYLPYLRMEGIEYSLHSFWSKSAYKILYKNNRYYFKKAFSFICGTISRIIDFIAIMRYDIVFIHREAYPIGAAFFETILSILKKPIIFDFDDAIFLPAPSRPNDFIERFKRPDKVAHIIKISSHVIAGNQYLSDFALRYNRSVSIIPTPIDTDTYYPDTTRCHNKEVVIGWIGSITALFLLDAMKDIFICLSKKFPHVRFVIVGGGFSVNGLSNVMSKQWSLEEEKEDLKTFDIGIMPMPENEWTKGKCGFKAILYMSMGIPCVCSPVGVSKEIIRDGVNGFLAGTDDEWIKKLSLLIEDPELRSRLGAAGRKTVEDNYSLRVNAPKYLEILKKVYEDRYKKRGLS